MSGNLIYFTGCPVQITGDTGKIYSPGYPNQYGSDVTCTYTITMGSSGPQAVDLSMTMNLQNGYVT